MWSMWCLDFFLKTYLAYNGLVWKHVLVIYLTHDIVLFSRVEIIIQKWKKELVFYIMKISLVSCEDARSNGKEDFF